jgi:hypothetical protein
MAELVQHQSIQAADHRKIVPIAHGGDISPEPRGQGSSSCTPEATRDGGDCVTFFLAPGQWPRVFPGL